MPLLIALFFIIILPCSSNLYLKFFVNVVKLENSNNDEKNEFMKLLFTLMPSITK